MPQSNYIVFKERKLMQYYSTTGEKECCIFHAHVFKKNKKKE